MSSSYYDNWERQNMYAAKGGGVNDGSSACRGATTSSDNDNLVIIEINT